MEYSPILSVLTGIFEVALMGWLLWGRNERKLRLIMAALLGLLAGYQFLEAYVCGYGGGLFFSRLAFADIAWLPATGIALIVALARPKARWKRWGAGAFLGMAGVWTAVVMLVPGFISMTVCEAVFAKYMTQAPVLYNIYGLYYDLGLTVLLFGGIYGAASVTEPLRRSMIIDFVAGNLAFVLAALVTMLAVKGTRGASPSILCHYAIMLAVAIGSMGWRLDRAAAGLPEEERPRHIEYPA